MKYGLPYQGSKSRIAEWVLGVLPKSHTLVDLFAGGGAITHCALLSGKYDRIIANDITGSMKVFCAAINGEFENYGTCATREEWEKYREDDTALALIQSFGNDKTTYLWGDDMERIKHPASMMVCAPSIWERYKWFHKFINALASYIGNTERGEQQRLGELQTIEAVSRLQTIERVSGLQTIERVSGLHGLECTRGDYRIVDIPDGATVYCDPPYRGTANSSRYGAFDFDAFDSWINGVDFPVYISEFDAPPGCVEIARCTRITSMSANSTDKRIEKIFIQERFKDQYEPEQGRLL